MGKSRIRTSNTYFVVTTEGKLKKLNPFLLGLAGALILALVVLISNRCYALNKGLVAERVEIHTDLIRMNSEQYKLSNSLEFCEEKKNQISQLLHFNTDSESTKQVGKTDEK